MRAAIGRDPIAGTGAPDRVVVAAIDVPFVDLVGFWFKAVFAAAPVGLVLAVLYAILRKLMAW